MVAIRCLSMVFCFVFILADVTAADLETNARPLPVNAVVRVSCQQHKYNYNYPWQSKEQNHYGSGFAVSTGTRVHILTAAHVVQNSIAIAVHTSDGHVTSATIAYIDHSVDLALLAVNADLFRRMTTLNFYVGLAPPQTPIYALGFPSGGEELAITHGIISRIEMFPYVHSGHLHLAAQIDVPINSGSSGGPVITRNDHAVVGVTFQNNNQLDKTGRMIPIPVIRHFLADAKADVGKRGFPDLGVHYEGLNDSLLRQYLNVPDDVTGIMVKNMAPLSDGFGRIQNRDIITAVNSRRVYNDGSVDFEGLRVNWEYVIRDTPMGDEVLFSILRNGKAVPGLVRLSKTSFDLHLVEWSFDTDPAYYMRGGMLFQPLTLNYMARWGDHLQRSAPNELLSFLDPVKNVRTSYLDEIVVLNRVMRFAGLSREHVIRDAVVKMVNNKPVRSLRDMIRSLEDPSIPIHTIVLSDGELLVLPNVSVSRAEEDNEARVLGRLGRGTSAAANRLSF